MTAFPLLIFIGSLLLAIVFEFGYAFVDKRWATPLDKEHWGVIYWLSIIITGATSGLISMMPPITFVLAPFFFVMIVHLIICITGGSFERYGRSPCHKASGNIHSSTKRNPFNKELFSKRHAGQNNNNCRPEGDEE